MMRFLLAGGLVLMGSVFLGGCVPAPVAKDYADFRAADPHSILVLPPINNAVDVDAPSLYLSTISRSVGERGYYVFPVNMVQSVLAEDGLSDANLVHQAPPEVLAGMFGADSVLYVTIQRWDAQYIVLNTSVTVAFDYSLRSGTTGDELWADSATRVFQSNSNNSNGGLGGLLADVIVAAIEKASPSYVPMAKQANAAATSAPGQGLPAGKYHPMYGKDQDKF